MAVGWLGRTALGTVTNWGKRLLSGGMSKAAQEAVDVAVDRGVMSREQATIAFQKVGKGSFLGRFLKIGGIVGGVDLALNGWKGIVGGLGNKWWTDLGRAEAEQNTVGRFHGFYKFVQELLAMFGIKDTFINRWAEAGLNRTKVNSESLYSKYIQDNPMAAAGLAAAVAVPAALPSASRLMGFGKKGGEKGGDGPPNGPKGSGNGPDGNTRVRIEPMSEAEKIEERMEAERTKAANAGKPAAAANDVATKPAMEAAEDAATHGAAKAGAKRTFLSKMFRSAASFKGNAALTGVLAAGAGAYSYLSGASNADAAEAAADTLGYGETVHNLHEGNYTEAVHSATTATTSLAGGVAGAGLGMAWGAAAGSVVPVAGTFVGGIVGGIAGGLAGSGAGSIIGEAAYTAGSYIAGGLSSVFNSKANPAAAPELATAPTIHRDTGLTFGF